MSEDRKELQLIRADKLMH